ncbi:MAG: YARHG domain-containing protein [Pyrinomonadaceae bacterium]
MKIKTLLIAAVCAVFFSNFVFANDGVFYAQGGTIMPMQETQVSLRKEILKFFVVDFEFVDVDIDFEFYNPGEEKTVIVGFVTPPAGGDVDENGIHPRISKFTVNVNGRNIPYKVERMKDTSFKGANDVEVDGYDYVYYFPVTFKKGSNKILHTYRFQGGGSVETQRDFDYQITTGKRWANHQIDDFEMQIHLDRGIFFIPLSFQEDGTKAGWEIVGNGTFSDPIKSIFEEEKPTHQLVQLKNGYLSLKKKNFRPDNDISIGEYNWAAGWYSRMCKDQNRCPDGGEMGDNFYQYFSVSPSEYATIENLEYLSKKDLSVVRNFAYAIRGYDFKTASLKDFYSQFFWYKPDPELKLEDIKLSSAEEEFLKKVAAAEKKK